MEQIIKNLPEKYLKLILEDDTKSPYGGISHYGETLEEFISTAGLSENASITYLHKSLLCCGIVSPFQTLNITVEVSHNMGVGHFLSEGFPTILYHTEIIRL